QEAGLSIGSIYKHMQSKEDVLIALNAEALKHRHGIYLRTFALALSTPEKLMAASLFDYKLVNRTSFDDQLSLFVFNDAILNRGSERWVSVLHEWRMANKKLFEDLMKSAIASSELRHDGDPQPVLDRLYTGLWLLQAGHRDIASQKRGRNKALTLLIQRHSPI